MRTQRCLCLCLAGVCCFLPPAPGRAPEPRLPYVQIPFEAGLVEQALGEQLLEARDIEQLRQLLENIKKDPVALKLLAGDGANLDVNDSRLRSRLEKVLTQEPGPLN